MCELLGLKWGKQEYLKTYKILYFEENSNNFWNGHWLLRIGVSNQLMRYVVVTNASHQNVRGIEVRANNVNQAQQYGDASF